MYNEFKFPENKVQELLTFVRNFQKSSRRGRSVPLSNKAKKLEDVVKGVTDLDIPGLFADALRYQALASAVIKAATAPETLNLMDRALIGRLQEFGNEVKSVDDLNNLIDLVVGQ